MQLTTPTDVSASQLALTGQAAWNAANNNAANNSGNITTTGQTLRSNIVGQSGYAEAIYLHRTGNELVSGDKTFNGNIYISGAKVGIGTITPQETLTISGSSAVNLKLETSSNVCAIAMAASGITGFVKANATDGGLNRRFLFGFASGGGGNSLFTIGDQLTQADIFSGPRINLRSFSGDINVGDNYAKDFFWGIQTGAAYCYIEPLLENSGAMPLVIHPYGNNGPGARVGLGVTNPSGMLHVNGEICLSGLPTATTANVGGATVPLTAVGFVVINITGSNFKIPYYNM